MSRLHAPPLLLALIVFALVAVSCASAGRGVRPRTGSATPWVVPREEHRSQRLFQVRLDSSEGSGRFRLLLRLRDPERYQIRATHPLFNRRLWSLDVSGDRAVLVDHHQRTVCRYQDEAEIGAIPLGPFPFESLPALLLGYLPLMPAQEPERPAPGLITFYDNLHRRWTALLDSGVVRRWEVAGEEIGIVSWERRDDWDVLAAPAQELDLRLKETLREDLTGDVQDLDIPADYDAQHGCDLGWLRAVEDAPWQEDQGEGDGTD
ncbi:MAG TPA: hypothetical protein VMS86_07890 [Thermoanaerobaculia bacterium]|nr:hypothetical protein [Thermoanaerobaculia bacterium]